jgi:hypothetical protein
MSLTDVTQFIGTVSDVMTYMANFAGGEIPAVGDEEFDQWMSYIQAKYEEASKRGFWRRLLTKDELSLTADDTEVLLPIRFQRPNSLYVLVVDGIDLADPDRTPDDQQIYIEMENDPTSNDYGRWKISFKEAIETTQNALMWYFATPPKPTESADKIILPGDMIAYGALAEHFRAINLEGSQDAAAGEYENRLNGYLALEMIPSRHELLKFITNPRGLDYLRLARSRYQVRIDRVARNY